MMTLLRHCQIIGAANVSPDGYILDCNAEYARIQGDDVIHLVGKNIVELTSPEDRDRTRVSLAKLSNGDADSVQHDKTFLTRSGQLVSCRCQLMAIRDSSPPQHISIIYEYNSHESHVERIAKLEEYVSRLLDVIARSQGVSVTMTGQDNSNNATADNQSQATISNVTTNNTVRIAVISVVAVIAFLAAVTAVAVYVGLPAMRHSQVETK